MVFSGDQDGDSLALGLMIVALHSSSMVFIWVIIEASIPPKLRPPLVERRIAHAVFTAQVCHRNTALSLARDRKNQWVAVSVGFHSKSHHAACRENPTCEAF